MLQDLWNNNRMVAMLIAILIVVVPFLIYYVIEAKKKHPKGLISAALSNMGERFGYYIMNAVLLLFLCSKFGISDDIAGWIYAVFYFLIYVLSLPGGMVADKLQNFKGTIMAGLLVMATGTGKTRTLIKTYSSAKNAGRNGICMKPGKPDTTPWCTTDAAKADYCSVLCPWDCGITLAAMRTMPTWRRW